MIVIIIVELHTSKALLRREIKTLTFIGSVIVGFEECIHVATRGVLCTQSVLVIWSRFYFSSVQFYIPFESAGTLAHHRRGEQYMRNGHI